MKPLNECEIHGLVLERLHEFREANDIGMISGSPRMLAELLSKRQVVDACTALANEKLIRFNPNGEFAHILPKGIAVVEAKGKTSPVKLSFEVAEATQKTKKTLLEDKSSYVESIQKHVFFVSSFAPNVAARFAFGRSASLRTRVQWLRLCIGVRWDCKARGTQILFQ